MAIIFKNNKDNDNKKATENDLSANLLQSSENGEIQEKPYKKKSKLLKTLLVFQIIALCIASIYVLIPVFTFLRVLFFATSLLFFFSLVALATVCTAGVIWLSEPIRKNISSIWNFIIRGLDGAGSATEFISTFKVFVLIFCSFFILFSFIASIVKYKKDVELKHYFVTNVVLSSIYLVIFLIIVFAY